MNNANMWKYNGRINAAGLITTLGIGFGIPQNSGSAVHSHYLFDDLTMTSLLLFGTVFSTVGSYYHYYVEKNAHTYNRHQLDDQRINLLPFSMIGAGSLGAAALYAFDVAFFGGQIFGSPRTNAGPETTSETILYCGLYSIVAIAALLVAFAEVRALKHSFSSGEPASINAATESTRLVQAPYRLNQDSWFSKTKNFLKQPFSPYNRL